MVYCCQSYGNHQDTVLFRLSFLDYYASNRKRFLHFVTVLKVLFFCFYLIIKSTWEINKKDK